jgi:hypothetical protein
MRLFNSMKTGALKGNKPMNTFAIKTDLMSSGACALLYCKAKADVLSNQRASA